MKPKLIWEITRSRFKPLGWYSRTKRGFRHYYAFAIYRTVRRDGHFWVMIVGPWSIKWGWA